jgi:hypothetical protein
MWVTVRWKGMKVGGEVKVAEDTILSLLNNPPQPRLLNENEGKDVKFSFVSSGWVD